jgi:hypothetical protein
MAVGRGKEERRRKKQERRKGKKERKEGSGQPAVLA